MYLPFDSITSSFRPNVCFLFTGKIAGRSRNYGSSRHDDVDDEDIADSMGDPSAEFSEFSLYCIKKDNPFRKICISILLSP
jgi:hypothetical protein